MEKENMIPLLLEITSGIFAGCPLIVRVPESRLTNFKTKFGGESRRAKIIKVNPTREEKKTISREMLEKSKNQAIQNIENEPGQSEEVKVLRKAFFIDTLHEYGIA